MSTVKPGSMRWDALAVLAACVLLPLAGAWAAGRDLAPLFRFPPPLEIPDYPRFSWIAVSIVGAVSVAVAWPWVRRRAPRQDSLSRPKSPAGAFPVWGWAGLIWTGVWWWLAWTRQPWFSWGQSYTFTPLWLGFIVVVNALTFRRAGTCLLRRSPWGMARLFVASAVFWWLFEWLNRYVRNWHYLGVAGVGPLEYGLHTTVCFSTVLPAVASAREWLGTWPRLEARLAIGPAWRPMTGRTVALALLGVGTAGLLCTGAWPVYSYPALWMAPLLLGVGVASLRGRAGWWTRIAAGDWSEAGAWALAALFCGFFWELWNLHSQAKWIYTVPFAQRWQVFEMPLAGYTGYLPFGLECGLVVAWLAAAQGRALAH